ncbi:Carbonic anhydrase 2 [Eumeta japonica]|uniref:Carbonic anhydrase n=1 Tax=Eumeta variegata TaxID=151549 RepID=A0A4C1U6M0_EUMVA|nr:Carbonic anhydrase 2 [Eumeta japonica]
MQRADPGGALQNAAWCNALFVRSLPPLLFARAPALCLSACQYVCGGVAILMCLVALHDCGTQFRDQYEWPGKCNAGRHQSPLALVTRDAVRDWYGAHIRGPLLFQNYDNVTMYGLNNGHTLRWNVAPGNASTGPLLSGGPLRADYKLLQFHMHWLSEHAIDGYKYPLEIHFVHVRTDVDSLDEALAMDDGLAVVGVMCQVSNAPGSDEALEQIMPQVPAIVSPVDVTPEVRIDIMRFLSPNLQSFFTYSGSLTTPYCQEAVTWIVMDHPIVISDEQTTEGSPVKCALRPQYLQITRAEVGGVHNYRRLQPANRVVYHSASCASALAPPAAGALAAAAAALYCAVGAIGNALHHIACKIVHIKKRFFSENIKTCILS